MNERTEDRRRLGLRYYSMGCAQRNNTITGGEAEAGSGRSRWSRSGVGEKRSGPPPPPPWLRWPPRNSGGSGIMWAGERRRQRQRLSLSPVPYRSGATAAVAATDASPSDSPRHLVPAKYIHSNDEPPPPILFFPSLSPFHR